MTRVMAKAALILASIFLSSIVLSSNETGTVTSTNSDRFFRINISAQKGLVTIVRKSDHILVRTLDIQLGQDLISGFKKLKYSKNYIQNILAQSKKGNFTEIKVKLSSMQVDAYNFYRDREKAYVIDFWNDTVSEDDKKLSESAVSTKPVLDLVKKAQTESKITKNKSKPLKVSSTKVKKKKVKERDYLDFRYGAAFIWDYDPLLPEIKDPISLEIKTPEFFYKIKDRDADKNEVEAHLQLVINLYRGDKFGLMYKAIKLFREKYGQEEGNDVIGFLQANALLKENLKNKKTDSIKPAIKMIENVGLRTKDYDLKKGVLKYLGVYYRNAGDYIKALSLAKQLYVSSKESFDYEESKIAANYILYYIAKLNQIDDLEKLAKDKTISKLLPTQTLVAYKYYVMLKQEKSERLINQFEKIQVSLAKPIHHGVLFNVSEAYFREGQYDKAIASFDEFLKYYSYHRFADAARVRLALCYEILEKDYKQTESLYENAINRSSAKSLQYEAKVRYIGLRSIRKIKLSEADKEIRVFLDRKSNETFKMGPELEQLLWLIRLRVYIKDENYDKSLAYLKAIPTESMPLAKARTFISEGAEIVSGLIEKKFNEGKSHIVIRLWEVYSKRYFSKVAIDPYIYYLVGKSYITLRFFDSFERLMARFEKFKSVPARTYPIWRKQTKFEKIGEYINLLKIHKNIDLKNWELAKQVNKSMKGSPMHDFYRAYISYETQEYKEAISAIEKFITENSNIELDEVLTAKLHELYAESLYKTKQINKFQKVVSTILQKKNLGKNDNLNEKIFERIYYLYLENLNQLGSKSNFAKLESETQRFISVYDESSYANKVKYLLGLAYLKNLKQDNAKKVFEEILGDQKTTKSIKELARTELTLINLRNKKI